MAFYDYRVKKPRHTHSPGPEDGYRPRGGRGQAPEKRGQEAKNGQRPPRKEFDILRDGYPPRGERGKGPYGKRQDARFGDKPPRKDAFHPGGERTAPGKRPAPPRDEQAPRAPRPPHAPRPPRAPHPAYARPAEPPVRPPFDGDEPLPRENLLSGRNPIREALKSGRDIERLLVAKGELSGSAREIVAMARERHVVVQVVDRVRLDEITQNHQGMIAFASAFRYSTVEDMLTLAKERGQPPLLVILDGVTDPHNLGAIIRSAECAGAHGVIVPERRAVGLTPAAVKASAGAVEYVPVARVGNLTRLLQTLKDQGIWITAADMAGQPYTKADLTGPLALVIGAEGSGVSRLVLETSDRRVALPMAGKIDSLNASVAAGVLLYEVRRQRG